MSYWRTDDFKCCNEKCELHNKLLIDILYKTDKKVECESCGFPLTKQITTNWSQGRHPSVSAWRV